MTIIEDTKDFIEGFHTVCNAVKKTLGVEGKLAVLEAPDSLAFPSVTKDGVSVAKHITEDDRVKLLGNLLAKQCAMKTLSEVGDNTTTTLVLAQGMLNSVKPEEFNKKVEKGFNIAYEQTQRHLKRLAKKPNSKTIKAVATVASNNDKNIGELVAKAYELSGGDNGFISYDKNRKLDGVVLKSTDGLKLERGMFSPICINNQQKATYDTSVNDKETKVIVYEGFLAHENPEVKSHIVNNIKNYNIVLVLERIGDIGEFTNLTKNITHQKDYGSLLVVEGTRADETEREQVLRDIALYTDGEVFIQGTSKIVKPGTIDKVTSDLNNTYFVSHEKKETVEKTISEITDRIKNITPIEDPNGNTTEFLEYRKKLLSGKTINIQVGGANDIEIGEISDRVDDAIRAVGSVADGGWLVGGGASLAHIYGLLNSKFDNPEIQKGYDAFRDSILAPMKQICKNSRREEQFKNYLKSSIDKYGLGYNGSTDEVSNLIRDNIIDSKKGLSSALKNAKSTAVLMLNVDVISIVKNASLF